MAKRKAEEHREFWTDFRCPICYNDREPLLYTDCGHKLCKDCVNSMFKEKSGANPTISCHACRKQLRRKDITPKSREETEIEEEITHRVRLKKE